MMQRWFTRAALTALIGLGVAGGLARAQAPGQAPVQAPGQALAPVPGPNPEPWAVIDYGAGSYGAGAYGGGVYGGGVYGGGAAAVGPLPVPDAQVSFPKKGPVRDWAHDCLHRIGVGCWSHHNAYLCSSWKSEFTFVFGSCRQFFGEPCLAGPPPPPGSAGYGPGGNAAGGYGAGGYGAGYGAAGQQQGCANCRQ
jgi:hypothetical protein